MSKQLKSFSFYLRIILRVLIASAENIIAMIVTLVHVWVKPESRDDFLNETLENHENSIKEPGNLRFDLLQDDNDENKFVIYEAYKTQEDVLAHKETTHYLNWRIAVADMMAKPRVGQRHTIVRPVDTALW